MPGSSTTRGQPRPRVNGLGRIAFCFFDNIGAPILEPFAAQWLAYTLLCQRFTWHLAAPGA